MKVLYYMEIIVELNDFKFKRPGYAYAFYYREFPEDETFNYTFDDAREMIDYFYPYDFSFFKFKSRSVGIKGMCDDYYVKEKDFKSASLSFIAHPIDPQKVSIKELATKLSAWEFAEWCKDNGMTAINIL